MQNLMPEMLFFGAVKQPGHFLHRANGQRAGRSIERSLPFRAGILDGGLLPESGEQPEGAAGHCELNGWTIVSFWDRSVDKRPGSNSAFLFADRRYFPGIIAIAKLQLPWFWERINFEVVKTY